MPRPLRVHDTEKIAHLTMHAVGTERLFTLEPEALSFLRILGDVVARGRLELFAYCLMSTQIYSSAIRKPAFHMPCAT
jgi:hypothetical protein